MSINEKDCQPKCQFTDSQQWETSYQEALLVSKDLINDEQLRRLRLDMLIQEYQKKDLFNQILTRDNTISIIEQQCKNLSVDLVKAEEKASELEKCLQSQESDLIELRAGLKSLSKISEESVDRTARVSCISDDLKNLKHEIENLRVIATSYESILEENALLRQRVDLLENKSDSQYYVNQVNAHKDKSQENLGNKIIHYDQNKDQKVENVISDLAEDKQRPQEAAEDIFLKSQGQQEEVNNEENQEKIPDKNFLNILQELEVSKIRQAALENDLSKMHEKLKDYEIQKNNLQVEYDKSQSLLSSIKPDAYERQPKFKIQHKRDFRWKNNDASIGTPGGVANRASRNNVKWGCTSEQTSVGKKSLFSITPFLNRTLDIEKEFSNSEDEDFPANNAREVSQIMIKNHTQNDSTATDSESKSSPQGSIKQTSKEKPHIKRLASMIEAQRISSLTISNEKSQRVKRTKSDCLESLEKIVEEVNDLCKQEKKDTATSSSSLFSSKFVDSKAQIQGVDENERRKQKNKRTLLKVGAMNLDNEGIELPSSEIEADYPALRLPKNDIFPTLYGGIGEKFRTFSPLKRDRVRRDKNIIE